MHPQVQPSNFTFSSRNGVVAQNANELWAVLVCKPWLEGEFGTMDYTTGQGAPTAVNTYGRQLLWAQAIATNETPTHRADPGQAGHLLRHRQQHPAE